MNLSSAQKTTVRTWLTNNASAQSDDAAAGLLNALASPAYFIWKSNADRPSVDGQVNKANYTPSDATPASGSTVQITNDLLVYNNRALLAQLKQTNAQWLTQGTSPIDARVVSVRQNFKDCLLQIPTGASGVNQDAGWGTAVTVGAVRAVMMRQISVYEQLFVTAAGTGPGNATGDARGANTNPDLPGIGSDGLSIEGTITAQNVSDIRNNL